MRQRAAFAYCAWLRDSLDALLSHFERVFGDEVQELIAGGCWLAAAVLNSRALEACSKFLNNLGRLRPPYEKWVELRSNAEGQWPTVDWHAIEERLAQLQQKIELSTAELLLPLYQTPKHSALPDFFGQALAVSTNACFEAVVKGNGAHAGAIFPPIFTTSLAACAALMEQLKNQPPETLTLYSTQPLDNLMELSGYAILYTELGHQDAWDPIKAQWDNRFSDPAGSGALANWMLRVMNARALSFRLPPGSSMQSSWKQRVRDDLRSRGISADPFGFPIPGGESQMSQLSPLIRAWLRGGMRFHAADVFLAFYLLQQRFIDKTIRCERAEDFLNAYRREQRRDAAAPGEADE